MKNLTRISLAWIGIALLATAPALAASDTFAECTFELECFEADACTATDFQATVEHDDTLAFIMRTVSEDIGGVVFENGAPEAASILMGQTDTASHLLTIQPGGATRYTVHMQGPLVVSYMGTCEVAK